MNEIDFPVVGIGASAGGLKALQKFFDHLPDDSGMAFVIIVHLAPQKSSAMGKLLSSHTPMDVQQVSGTTKVEPNHIYIIPPSKQLRLQGDQLLVEEKEKDSQAVIDVFFRSLAEECEKKAIGIILSGSGSDGSLGLKAIKEHGGIMMVQDPKEAAYNGMPLSAIETNLVDFELPVKELAQKVLDYKNNLGKIEMPLQEEQLDKREKLALGEIFKLLDSKKNHDFSQYKRSSVLRRLQRRLYISNCKTITEYREYLDKNPDEIDWLFDDLLISVTNFFRDPEAFEQLAEEIIPKLFKDKEVDKPIRIWVVGCATGEEVYSLAILLDEYASTLDYKPHIKIFGTDISDDALRVARKGIYPETIASEISEERLLRYFHKEDRGYQISEEIRNMVLISKHNILADPPFVNQDLISFRNLLIYFKKDLQSETLKIAHHALRSGGYLFLGLSDSTIAASDYFAPVNKSKGIYISRRVPSSIRDVPPLSLLPNMKQINLGWRKKNLDTGKLNFDEIHHSLLADQYAPPSIIVNEDNKVMHSSKGINRYLHYAGGEPSHDLLKMVSPQIRRPLQNIIFEFNQHDDAPTITKNVAVQLQNQLLHLNLKIRPIQGSKIPQGYRQIVFEEMEESGKDEDQKIPTDNREFEESEVVLQLEKELEQTREQLQQVLEEYGTSNEELMASNEELQSMNEELQTTTEELETSKEELQSVNEELKFVNEELETKIEELQKANNDLKNLMEATEIGILFVDSKMRIKRFTQSTNKLFNLIASDLGRPLSHITHHIQEEDLIKQIESMLGDKKLDPIQKQIRSSEGKSYMMHIKPYNTTDYKVEGAVLTFVDITELEKVKTELEEKIEIQKQLQQDVLRVEKKERWSIGQFLHDEISQNLLAIKLMLDSSPQIKKLDEDSRNEINDIKQLIVESLQNIRGLSHFVLPLAGSVSSASDALTLLVKQTKNVYDVECMLTTDDISGRITDDSITSSLYYIAQEAITNAIKHGNAQKIDITLSLDNNMLNLTIEDNGIGYNREKDTNGQGINIMHYRTELLGGKSEIKRVSEEGGTIVKCVLPIEENTAK
ncbi:chemotaxis protein CheB [Fodinibius salsisoli]|uniref:PAS domain-containing protein n=1 Tax=Fodinibius salsisoli TaxID=2820877 RepID=A0ABT3PIG1_9BACT|nr:chemotaxis protein CheB [Fodinibius salsisoli]MCW9705720.1 PAS domain-containing protein [Fodinibius salsisoli]